MILSDTCLICGGSRGYENFHTLAITSEDKTFIGGVAAVREALSGWPKHKDVCGTVWVSKELTHLLPCYKYSTSIIFVKHIKDVNIKGF